MAAATTGKDHRLNEIKSGETGDNARSPSVYCYSCQYHDLLASLQVIELLGYCFVIVAVINSDSVN